MFNQLIKTRKKQLVIAIVLVSLYLIIIGKINFEQNIANFFLYYLVLPIIIGTLVVGFSKRLFRK